MAKLQDIGFTRKPDDVAPQSHAAPRQAPPLQAPAMQPARPAPQAPRAPAPQMRRDPAGLDIHGRPAQAQRVEDDHLDIPAFLRRQAN